jgi:hypothetical protein
MKVITRLQSVTNGMNQAGRVTVSRPIRREFFVKLRELDLKRPVGALAFL